MKHPILLLILTALITIINYFDRTAFSYTILPLEHDLGLNNQQFGTVAGMFGLGYLIITLFAGQIVDRYGSVRTWGYSAIVWSIITMLIGTATGFWSLSGLLILLGLAEGFNSASLLRTAADWFPPRWRARAVSLSLLGVPVASVIGAPFITSLIEHTGWRIMFALIGILGIIWAIFWFAFFHKLKAPPILREPTPWKQLLTHPGYLANAFTFFTFGCIVFFVIIWLPGYFEQTHKIAIRDTGYLVMLPWLLSALLQTAGGWAIDLIYSKTHSIRKSRVYILCIGLFAASISFAFLAFSPSLTFSLISMSLGLGFTFMINPAIYSLNADLFPKHMGTAQSISTCCFAIAGIVSPTLTGWITQTTNSYTSAILFIATLSLLASLNAFIFCFRTARKP
jgi:MFS family permease